MEQINTQLETKLQEIKQMIDRAYDSTKIKYGKENANNAIANYFLNYQTNYFTRDNNARTNMEDLLYRPNEFNQILLDYAISSFLLNEMGTDITNEEINEYIQDRDGKLDYTGTKAVKVVAIVAGMNTYYAYNLLSVNQRLKNELVLNYIAERYIQNKRNELDNSKKSKIVKIAGYKVPVTISKSKLNNDVRNMNSDEEYSEYIVPSQKK